MKIFVTGGTGYLGRNFIELALKEITMFLLQQENIKKIKKI